MASRIQGMEFHYDQYRQHMEYHQWGTIRGKKKQGMISEDEYMQ
nr:hypothetical protein [uncultured Blautia sp.]